MDQPTAPVTKHFESYRYFKTSAKNTFIASHERLSAFSL